MIAAAVLLGAAVATATPPLSLPAAPEEVLEVVISRADQQPGDGTVVVDLRLLNNAAQPSTMALPDRIQAEILSEGRPRKVWLERLPQSEPRLVVPAGGFGHSGCHPPA